MSTLITLLVITAVAATDTEKDKPSITLLENLQTFLRENPTDSPARQSKELGKPDSSRTGKSFGYYPYYGNHFNYNPPQQQDLGYYFPQGKNPIPQEWRTEPFKRKTTAQLLDSPIYYVRLPASPYVFVPGVGYISRPPSLNEPGVLGSVGEPQSEPSSNGDSSFINLPIDFVSNGKPTSVYQLPNEHVQKPRPDQSYFNLNKGPYLFNGKPIELYFLRNSYNRIYADALTNFYP